MAGSAPATITDGLTPWWKRFAQLPLSDGQRSAVVQSAWLVGATAIARVFGVARGIIVARLLAPSDYGLLSALLLAAFYLQALELGVGYGMTRESPVLQGRGKTDEIVLLERQVFGWELAVVAIVGPAIAAYLFSGIGPKDTAWLVLPFFFGAELLRNTLQGYLQARGAFERLRRSMMWYATFDLVFAVSLTALWGIRGAAVALALSSAGAVAYLIWDGRHERPFIPRRISWTPFRTLLGVGFPTMVQNLMWNNMTNIDKLVILSMLNREALAYYSIAQTIGASSLIVASAVNRVATPSMIRRDAEAGNPAALHAMVKRTATVMAYGLLPFVAAMWLAGPIFFNVILPKYKAAVPLLDVTSVSMYAIGITFSVQPLYLARRRQGLSTVLLIGMIACTAGLGVLFTILGWNVLGVAYAAAIGSSLYLVAFMTVGFVLVGQQGQRLAADLGRVLLPFAVGVALAVLLALGSAEGLPRTSLAIAMLAATCVIGAVGIHRALRLPTP